MICQSKPLTKIIDKLTEYGAEVHTNAFTIRINIDITKPATDISKLKPLIYYTLNTYENRYFILITGIPYCLLPDAATHHILHTQKEGTSYQKEKHCKNCKYEKHCPGWESNHKISTLPPPIDNIPCEVVLEITKECNLQCPICFSPNSKKEIPLERIKAITDEIVNLGMKTIRFSGGEPLLHPKVCEAFYYAKSKNLYVVMNSNATVLNKKIEKAIKDCVDNALVSLQGFDSASEKFLTKSPMNFKKKMHNLVKLNRHIPLLRLGTIISKTFLKNFDKYYYLVRKLDIKHWELYRPLLQDRSGEFEITKEELLWVMHRMKEIRLDGFDLKMANPIPFCISDDLDISRFVFSGASEDDAHTRIVLDVDQFFKPSYFMSQNLGRTITDSWQNPFVEKIRSLDYLPQKCQDCSYKKWCKGGSRHLANMYNEDYFGLDPLYESSRVRPVSSQ